MYSYLRKNYFKKYSLKYEWDIQSINHIDALWIRQSISIVEINSDYI